MLTLFRKLLGKPQPEKPKAPASHTAQHEVSPPMPTVEVAHLSLAVIVARLPEDLQALVRQAPDSAATVALPIQTIVKQLPGGAVKISLATLHRQAPAGVFAPLPPGDKRMVSVPLAEIFRHVNPFTLKRRMDQRATQLPPSDFTLFGNSTNPYEIAADDGKEPTTLVIDDSLEPAVAPRFAPEPPAIGSGLRTIAPPSDYCAPSPHRVVPAASEPVPQPAVPKSNLPPLCLPLAPLTAAWPDEIQGELAALNGTASVLLPADYVTAGMAKGKVTFTWGEIRACIEPPLDSPTAVDESTPLTLPLKVVAPAFLAASRQPKQDVRKVSVAEDIPAVFSNGRAPVPPPEPVVEATSVLEISLPDEEAPAVDETPEPAPTEETPPAAFALVTEAVPAEEAITDTPPAADVEPAAEIAPVHEEAAPAVEPPPASEAAPKSLPAEEPLCMAEPEESPIEALQNPPAPTEESVLETAAKPALTIGAIFGEPEREHWTPADIVSRVTQFPSVSGAIIALQEGLLVAHSLPEDVKGEVVAAFLPQIFARLNHYAGEMKLGEVDDLLFTTRGAHCQIYRLGFVYFAILGKPGEPLPWNELRLIAGELAKQTQPS